jgi:hypothetical protein
MKIWSVAQGLKIFPNLFSLINSDFVLIIQNYSHLTNVIKNSKNLKIIIFNSGYLAGEQANSSK